MGRPQPGRKSRLRHVVRGSAGFRVGCSLAALAGLRLGASAAVDGNFGLKSKSALRLGGRAEMAAPPAVDGLADVHDVILEALLLAD